jgi:hypothetical protein
MIWKIVVPVIVASLIGWGAWTTVAVTGATPRPVFDEHVNRATDKYDKAQERLEDKIDDLKDTILDLHK